MDWETFAGCESATPLIGYGTLPVIGDYTLIIDGDHLSILNDIGKEAITMARPFWNSNTVSF